MAAHTHSIPKNRSNSAERWKIHDYGASSLKYPLADGDKESRSALGKGLGASLDKPSVLVAFSLGIIAVLALAIAFAQRKFYPEYIVTVQQFEISPEVSSRLAISGKGASDIVIDMLNRTATDGSRFHGAEYYAYDHHGTQPVALHQAIRIPVQSSYGIEVKGISIDSLIKLYDRIRYKEWIISGDILSSADGLTAKIRLNRDDAARSWQASASGQTGLSELIQRATALMLTEENPELLGRAYLTQEQYPQAAEVFRQWALHAPRDWRPYYYLSLAYDYQGKEQEATSLARWSRNIAEHEKSTNPGKPLKTSATDSANAAELAEITQTVWETRDVPNVPPLSTAEKLKQLMKLQKAEQTLKELCAHNEANLTYQIQLARTLDKEAAIEASLSPGSAKAFGIQDQAVALLAATIQKMPDNGGLHEQHAILLQHLVDMEKKAGKESQVIAEKESEEVVEFTTALELKPTQVSPLWAVLYALIDLKRGEDAVDLTRAITLLQPDSTAANAAYVVALERAMMETGRDMEREADVAAHLKPLLQNAGDSELEAIWHSCEDQHDRPSLLKLAATGRRRFPHNRTFSVAANVHKQSVNVALAKAPGADHSGHARLISPHDEKDPRKGV